jgi:hypothetical protein
MKTFKQLKKEKQDKKSDKANKKIKKVKPPKALKPATHREMIERSTLVNGSLKFGEKSIDCRHAEDFKILALQHLSETAAVLAFCFGVKTKVLQVTASGRLELVNGFISAKDQYVNTVHAFNGEPELAKIIVGWCVLACVGWERLIEKEHKALCSVDFARFVCAKGWESAFVTKEQIKQFNQSQRDYWSRYALMTPEQSSRINNRLAVWQKLRHKGYPDDRPVDPRTLVGAIGLVCAPLHPSMAHLTAHSIVSLRPDDIYVYHPSDRATLRYCSHEYEIPNEGLINTPKESTFSHEVQDSQGKEMVFRGCYHAIHSRSGDNGMTVLRPIAPPPPRFLMEEEKFFEKH